MNRLDNFPKKKNRNMRMFDVAHSSGLRRGDLVFPGQKIQGRVVRILPKENARIIKRNVSSIEKISLKKIPRIPAKKITHSPWSSFSFRDMLFCSRYCDVFFVKKSLISFSFFMLAGFFMVSLLAAGNKGLKVKKEAFSSGEKAMASLFSAKEGMARKDFYSASLSFEEAQKRFSDISFEVESFGKLTVEISRYLPFFSKLSSGANLAKAGENISKAGILVGEILGSSEKIKNPLGEETGMSYLEVFENYDKNIREISRLLGEANECIEKINVDDLPKEKQREFVEFKEKLPQINQFLLSYVENSRVFSDLLGGNGPRKFLFLFQNNQEMRATGGFIGTYAILEITDGRVKNFSVDGIFNPDGQLKEWIVPPFPIQKISVNWSLHDSNWFPDFPVSAEKAAFFWEKTGGPTVDGVITMTPDILGDLLEITGPIEMSEYGTTIGKENFLETIQYEVEVDYDREENKPKEILADLAPIILDKIFNAEKMSDIAKTMEIMLKNLNEKKILIYSKNWEIEKIISEKGWSGEVLDTQKDYLSVINTNINGYKTDGVVNEGISLKSEIQPDGSIINTLKIKREHTGGDTEYDWWNRVNADYMRVYVPKGSRLISASGQTREFNRSPVDYDNLGYKRDPQVEIEENGMIVDEESGTKIYEDAEKTVFANWVYVSPKETSEISYVYVLPFKVNLKGNSGSLETHSVLFQKQSGSRGSALEFELHFPENLKTVWSYPETGLDFSSEPSEGGKNVKMKNVLESDKFFGLAFSRK